MGNVAKVERSIAQDANSWAEQITAEWRKSVESVIATGRLLIEAKAALKHGQFGDMCERLLPFSIDTAQRLMAIARDNRLTDPALSKLLPPSWGTLYDITRLSDAEIQKAVEKKVIRPDVERWELEGFRRGTDQQVKKAANDDAWTPRMGPPDVRLWTIAQVRANAKLLQAILKQAGAASQLTTVGDVISDRNLKKIWGE